MPPVLILLVVSTAPVCNTGYQRGNVNYNDVNECAKLVSLYALESHYIANAECTNTDGSNKCASSEGL